MQQLSEKDDNLFKSNGCFDSKRTLWKNMDDVRSRYYTFKVTNKRHLESCTPGKGLRCKCGDHERGRYGHRSREPSRISLKVKRGMQKGKQFRRVFKRKVVPRSSRLVQVRSELKSLLFRLTHSNVRYIELLSSCFTVN